MIQVHHMKKTINRKNQNYNNLRKRMLIFQILMSKIINNNKRKNKNKM